MFSIIILLLQNTFEDAIGTFKDALVTCPSNVTCLDGMHNSTYAYTINTSLTNLQDFNVDDIDVSDVSSTEYDFIIHQIIIGSDSQTTTEYINKTMNLFNV